MQTPLLKLLNWLPAAPHMSWAERRHSVLGAFIGLSVSAVLCHLLFGHLLLWFIAPMGASAVLLFVVPSSPLAQPWSVFGGNVVSALVGVACLQWLPVPLWLLAGVAGSLAIAAMLLCRCLHPPGGAVALTAVLSGAAVRQMGVEFVLTPVAINSALMVLAAIGFNRLVGRQYPHRQVARPSPHQTTDPLPSVRAGFDIEDLKQAFGRHDGFLDIGAEDLEQLFNNAKAQAFARRYQAHQSCADLMSRDVIYVQLSTSLTEALQILQSHQLSRVPVVNAEQQLQGWLSLSDFLLLREQAVHVLQPATDYWARQVADILNFDTAAVRPEQRMTDLVPLFSDAGLHQVAVTDAADQLLGIVTQSDLIAAIYQAKVMDTT